MSDIITNTTVAISHEYQDVIGEICNIGMGSCASTLSLLLSHRVVIDTPKVRVCTGSGLRDLLGTAAVGVSIIYELGLNGSSMLILRDRDVKIVTDIMMGGTGQIKDDFVLNEMDMSAIGEAMNQMVASSVTSLTTILRRKIEISTPKLFNIDFKSDDIMTELKFLPDQQLVVVSFSLNIADIMNSTAFQILHMDSALELTNIFKTVYS